MRVYVPMTLSALRSAVVDGAFAPVRGLGFAVTDGLRQEYPEAESAELEYLAMHDAALASLRLIAHQRAEPTRVVVTIDTSRMSRETGDDQHHGVTVSDRGDLDRAAVTMTTPIDWSHVEMIYTDSGDAAGVVASAAEAVDRADLEDPDAMIVVGDAEDIDLTGYEPSVIRYLLTELDR